MVKSHYYNYLGEYDKKKSYQGSSIDIVKYINTPEDKLSTYVTLGLSKFKLTQSSGKSLRIELCTVITSDVDEDEIANLLHKLAQYLKSEPEAPLKRGEVLTLNEGYFNKQGYYYLLVSEPYFFPSEFSIIDEDCPVIFALITPIKKEEKNIIQNHGVDNFFKLSEEQNIELCTFKRRSVRHK